MSLIRRAQAAWRAFRGVPCPHCSTALTSVYGAMSTAVALTTECSRPGGGDHRVIDGLLAELPRRDLAHAATAAAVLAATFGQEWSALEPDGPAELLTHIGLKASRRNV